MIKEYKLPGLYVLGVPEKSLISFVTFSLSCLVLTVSYLLYFYFRGCPVELALLPPVDKLGEPVEIAFDAVDELSGKDVAQLEEKIAIDAVKTDPGEKPSLISRFLGIFKKPKVPEEVIQEAEVIEEIQETETIVAETDVPVITPEEVSEKHVEESKSIKDKIVGFFKKSEESEPVKEVEESVPEEIEIVLEASVKIPEETTEDIGEAENLEEGGSIKDTIVGFFSKTESEPESVPESEPESIEPVADDEVTEISVDEVVVEEAVEEEHTEEETPTLTDKIVGFFQKSDTDDESADIADESEIEATSEEEELVSADAMLSQEDSSADEPDLEGSCEDLPEDKSMREKIWNFFGCGDEDVESVAEEETKTAEETEDSPIDIEEVADEIVEDEIPAENSIKAVVQSFLGNIEETTEDALAPESAEDEPVTETFAEEEIVEESSSIKDKIVEFFHTSEEPEEIVEQEPTAEEDVVADEAESEASAEEEIEEETSSIKDKIVEFFHKTDEPEETSEAESLLEDTPEETIEEAALTEEIGEIVESTDNMDEMEGSCEDLPEDKSLREKIWNFFGCGDKDVEGVTEEEAETVEEPVTSSIAVEEIVEVEDEIPEDNSIKAAVQSFLGTNQDAAEENTEEPTILKDQASEDIVSVEEEVVTVDESGKQQM